MLYISPLKALAVDIERNLRAPLAGIRQAARPPRAARAGHRRGGPHRRHGRRRAAAPASKPPDILITTPESLFLILTSQARDSLRGVDTVIVDEVHALAGNKRGAHLALSLERLDALRGGAVAGRARPGPGRARRAASGSGCRRPSGRRRRSQRSSAAPGR